jgi:hypothetical protein
VRSFRESPLYLFPRSMGIVFRVERPLEGGVVVRRDDQLVTDSRRAEERRQAGQELMDSVGAVSRKKHLAEVPIEARLAKCRVEVLRHPKQVGVVFVGEAASGREVAGKLVAVRKEPAARLPRTAGRTVRQVDACPEKGDDEAFADLRGHPAEMRVVDDRHCDPLYDALVCRRSRGVSNRPTSGRSARAPPASVLHRAPTAATRADRGVPTWRGEV